MILQSLFFFCFFYLNFSEFELKFCHFVKKIKKKKKRLEKESGLFFNHKYFEEMVLGGNWDELERYLLGFTSITDNKTSMKIFFEIRKQKYLEALDK